MRERKVSVSHRLSPLPATCQLHFHLFSQSLAVIGAQLTWTEGKGQPLASLLWCAVAWLLESFWKSTGAVSPRY